MPAWADCWVARKSIDCYACKQPTPRRVAAGRICVKCGGPFWPKSPDPAYDTCDPCFRGYESKGLYEIA